MSSVNPDRNTSLKLPRFTFHNKSFIIAAGFLCVLFFAGAAWAVYENNIATHPTPTPAPEESPILVEVYTPQVFIRLPDAQDFIEIQGSRNVPIGTTIKTDSQGRARALYPNHSVTRLDHNSQFTIENFTQAPFKAEVKLSKGNIWSRVAKLLGQETYETKSEHLVASIRGTSYGHTIMENGQDTIMVTEGKVNGDCINIEQASDVNKGQKASYPCADGQSIIERFMNAQEKQDEWYIFNVTEDKKLDEMYSLGTYTDLLGATVTTTPKPTSKPTAKSTSPTSTSTPQPTSTSTPTPNPTNSPTPSPAPTPTTTPTPPSISRFYDQNCWANKCNLTIYGSEFYDVTAVNAYNAAGELVESAQFTTKSTAQIDAYFGKLQYGNYYAQVATSSHGTAKSSTTFLVNQLF